MTFFSRCEAEQCFETGLRSTSARRARTPSRSSGFWRGLSGFAEDLGILFRYAAGLDYYGRDRVGTNHPGSV